jgi:diketogulonate reductase-like aldo/keto reductase
MKGANVGPRKGEDMADGVQDTAPQLRETLLVSLNNGVQMPVLGLGTLRCSAEQVANVVEAAIESGYRLIDTAAAYGNEQQVGEGIARSGIRRSEMFVTTKLWITDYGFEATLRSFDESMATLRLDYVDLYLLHWPVPSDFEATIASYQAAEKMLADGRVRAIGVSNFTGKHLDVLISRTTVVPAVNQVELHPLFNQHELRGVHKGLGIVTQSWSPLGGANRSTGGAERDPFRCPTIVELTEKHGKTPAQIILRWHIQSGLSAIPKSERLDRIAENIAIFDFALTENEMATIGAMDTGRRNGPDPDVFDATMAPVKK